VRQPLLEEGFINFDLCHDGPMVGGAEIVPEGGG
jgi:hypothetical protein